VREVSGWTCRTFEWFHVGLELNQISRDKTRSETQPPQNLDEKPCRVPARTAREFERLFRSLDARLHTDHVLNLALQPLIEMHEEVRRSDLAPIDRGQKLFDQRPGGQGFQERFKLSVFERFVTERILLGIRFQKKIEWVENRHFSRETDFQREVPGLRVKNETCEEIAVRILLPIDEVILRFYP